MLNSCGFSDNSVSIQFSNTTSKAGLIQLIEKNLGFADAGISGDATTLAQFTGDINLALDRVLSLIFQVGGTWQFDDSNHTDYPILTTDLVSGQRDYSFTADANSNLVLEIYKVMAKDSTGIFHEIFPVDVNTGEVNSNYYSGLNVGGIPITYDKLANGIFLDPIPNYASTAGLKIYVNREGSYFATSDTTKKAGFAGLFHEYLALRPSYQYALRKELPTAVGFKNALDVMEADIQDFYKSRVKDEQKHIRAVHYSSR